MSEKMSLVLLCGGFLVYFVVRLHRAWRTGVLDVTDHEFDETRKTVSLGDEPRRFKRQIAINWGVIAVLAGAIVVLLLS